MPRNNDFNLTDRSHLPAKVSLGFFPTPIVELKRLSRHLGGPELFMKRDDQSGLAMGGNKVRKLEYLVGEAIAQGADTLVTGGAAQSNHCRQTAAAAAMAGLRCHLALGGEEPEAMGGNLLLDAFFNARIHWCGEQRKGETIPDICEELRGKGRSPYVVPYGGSNPVGALGFVAAAEELRRQSRSLLQPFSHIVFASSSGGTHAGLATGAAAAGLGCELVGIAIDKEGMEGVSLEEYIVRLIAETARLCVYTPVSEPPTLIRDYTGAGYGVVGDLEREALNVCASHEGILLDPVYTGRAMGGMIDLVRKGFFASGDRVLFWHTGGTPALFAYGDELIEK